MIKIGFSGLRKPTPAKMKKLSAFVEAVFAALGGSALFSSKPDIASIFLICAGVTNKFFELFYEEQPTNNAVSNDGDNAA